MIEDLLRRPYWIIDILPAQVPAGAAGQYFAAERYYLTEPELSRLRRKQVGVILKLNCYMDLRLEEDGPVNPPPETLAALLRDKPLSLLLGGSLLVTDPGDTYMTLYDPDPRLLALVREIAAAEGLFVWQPEPSPV